MNDTSTVPHDELSTKSWLRFLLALTDLYIVSTGLFLLLRVVSGYRLSVIAFLSNGTHLILLFSVPLAILLAVLKRWYRLLAIGPEMIAFLWLYGGLLLPPGPSDCPIPCQPLTIMTYNLADGRHISNQTFDMMAKSTADLIAVQEVPLESGLTFQNQLERYPYQIIDNGGGIGLLSRYPIREYQYQDVDGNPYLQVVVDVDGRDLYMIVVHPQVAYFNPSNRQYTSRSQELYLNLVDLAEDGMPMVVAGDFNLIDQSTDYELLAASPLMDAFAARGWGLGLTYPTNHVTDVPIIPFLRIDYIWHTGHFKLLRVWVAADAGSDHRPLFAQMAWFEEPDSN